jgi:hypothetical protein
MHLKKFDATNINTIVTIIAIIVGIPSFYGLVVGYLTLVNALAFSSVFLLVLLLILMYANRKIIKRLREAETDVTKWKDKATKYQDQATVQEQELYRWKEDCRFLMQHRNELKLEIQRRDEELQRIYGSLPSENPVHNIGYDMDYVSVPSTPDDDRLREIHRRLYGS